MTTIEQNTWDSVRSAVGDVTQQQHQQQQVEMRNNFIRQSLKQLENAKDVILSIAGGEADEVVPGSGKKKVALKNAPALPPPDNNPYVPHIDDEPGLIAILAKVLSLQARMASNTWKSMWESATQSMNAEINFAPIIGQAVINNWNTQADITGTEKDQAFADAWINIGTFALSAGTGAIEWYSDYKKEADNTANQFMKETEDGADDVSKTASADVSEAADDINEELSGANSTVGKDVSKTFKKTSVVQKSFLVNLTKALNKASSAAVFWNQLGQGIQGFVNSHYLGLKQAKQGDVGQYDALEKMSQQYSQFFGQSFSREDSLREGSAQALQSDLQTLQSAADGLTRVTIGMFQG